MSSLTDERTIERVKDALFWLLLFPLAFARHLHGRVRWDAPRGRLLPQVLGMTLIWVAGCIAWSSLVWALAAGLSEWRGAIPDTMKRM